MPFVSLLMLLAPAFGAQVLKPQMVVDRVLAHSFQAVEIGLDAQDAFVGMEKALGTYDFKITSKAGYEYKEAEAVSPFANLVDRTLTAELGLSKSTSVGADLQFGYQHQSLSSILNPVVTYSGQLDKVTLDTAFVQWRQHFWSNSFGVSDRLDVAVARARLRESDLGKQEATEELVLTAVRAFWDAFVAQTQLSDAITARQQYKNLIGVVQKRGRFGLDKGGEYAQVMADYTDADGKVKLAAFTYLDKLKGLEVLMQTTFSEDLEFEAGEIVPPLPRLGPVTLEKLRKIQIAESAKHSALETSRAVVWRQRPVLDLVAKAASTGVDARASAAYSEFLSGTKPTYFVGLEFSTPLDSSARRAAEAEARVAAGKKENTLGSVRSDVTKNLAVLDRKLEETFVVANSAIEAEKYRSRTVREQEVEYRQGRLALYDLLQTYRLYFDAQARKVRAIGDYHIALNEMAAERDELVR